MMIKKNTDTCPLNKSGMTLIEMAIAMGIIALMCGGLYTLGIKVRSSGEHLRTETEARSYGRETIEELFASGKDNLNIAENTYLQPGTRAVPRRDNFILLTRTVDVIWHAADGSVVGGLVDNGYAEVHVNIGYKTPLKTVATVDHFSTIIY